LDTQKLTFTAILLLATVSSAATGTNTESLRGIKGVYLAIEHLSPEAKQEGLVESDIRKDLERKLRDAGVRVLTTQDLAKEPGRPTLYLNVAIYQTRDIPFCTYNTTLALNQDASLKRNSAMQVMATTWAASRTGISGQRMVLTSVMRSLNELVTSFTAAFNSVNAKPSSTSKR
jgi:hypothetical protein